MNTTEKEEKLARLLAKQFGSADPDYLEPGDALGIDGHNPNGEPCHFYWRQFVDRAREIINEIGFNGPR